MKGFYIYFTNDVSQGTHLLIFFVAKPNVYHYQKCHDSIIIRHSQSWAEHPSVVCKHPGPKYDKSRACVTNNLHK